MIEQDLGNGFKRRIEFAGAFDKRDPDPKKNYGICGMRLWFHFIGPKGATSFHVLTNMDLPHVFEETRFHMAPMGADIGYHSHTPLYEGQESRHCDLLPEGVCYFDGSGLAANAFMPTFLAEGDEAVWTRLEKEYKIRFEEEVLV